MVQTRGSRNLPSRLDSQAQKRQQQHGPKRLGSMLYQKMTMRSSSTCHRSGQRKNLQTITALYKLVCKSRILPKLLNQYMRWATAAGQAYARLLLKGPPNAKSERELLPNPQAVDDHLLLLIKARMLAAAADKQMIFLCNTSDKLEHNPGLSPPGHVVTNALLRWYRGESSLGQLFETHGADLVVTIPPSWLGKSWQQALLLDLQRLREQHKDVKLHVLVTLPPFSAIPSVCKLLQYVWLLHDGAFDKFIHKETWFRGLVDCVLPSDSLGYPRAQRVAMITLSSLDLGKAPVQEVSFSRASCITEMGTVVAIDILDTDVEQAYNEIEKWVADKKAGRYSQEWPVELLTKEARRSWATSKEAGRKCLDLIVHSSDGAVVAKCCTAIWESFTIKNTIYMGPLFMERMARGEKLLELKDIRALGNEELYNMTDWMLPVARNKVLVYTQCTAEEWNKQFPAHNAAAKKTGLPKAYRMLNPDGSVWATSQQQSRQDEAEEERENAGVQSDQKWSVNQICLTSSQRLPPFGDEHLLEWLRPCFESVLGSPIAADSSVQWEMRKRTNRHGRWGRRDIFIQFASEEMARKAVTEVSSIYQHDLSLGAVQWKLHSPHIKTNPEDTVRLSMARLALEDGETTTKLAQELESDAHGQFMQRSSNYIKLLVERDCGDLSSPPVSQLGPQDVSRPPAPTAAEIPLDSGPSSGASDADSERMMIEETAPKRPLDQAAVMDSPSQVSMSASPMPKQKSKARRKKAEILLATPPNPRRL